MSMIQVPSSILSFSCALAAAAAGAAETSPAAGHIMKQAASLKDFKLPLLLPGSSITTSPTDYGVIKYMKLQRFNGKSWDFAED